MTGERLKEIEERAKAAICPRCKKGELVHDFEGECWTQDRCPACSATWFNDPPRMAGDAPYFLRLKDTLDLVAEVRRLRAALRKIGDATEWWEVAELVISALEGK